MAFEQPFRHARQIIALLPKATASFIAASALPDYGAAIDIAPAGLRADPETIS